MGLEEKYKMYANGIEFISDEEAKKIRQNSEVVIEKNKNKLLKLRHIYETKFKPQQDAYWNSLTEEERRRAMEASMETFEEFAPYRQEVNEEFL